MKEERHLTLATNLHLEQLVKVKSCYVEGTFKLVQKPFNQQLSVKAFVRAGEYAKQAPLAFVLMSGKKEGDYKGVGQILAVCAIK